MYDKETNSGVYIFTTDSTRTLNKIHKNNNQKPVKLSNVPASMLSCTKLILQVQNNQFLTSFQLIILTKAFYLTLSQHGYILRPLMLYISCALVKFSLAAARTNTFSFSRKLWNNAAWQWQ
jgi:hypothetical protein